MEDNKAETIFERVEFDGDCYRSGNGQTVRFPKIMHVRIDGEVMDLKLSYTTQYDEAGEKIGVLPCLRLNGERVDLDDEAVEIASDCVIAS